MAKNRDKQRKNKKKEEQLNRYNEYGINDPTPYKAVKNMIAAK